MKKKDIWKKLISCSKPPKRYNVARSYVLLIKIKFIGFANKKSIKYLI
jgi:hypothetical protein